MIVQQNILYLEVRELISSGLSRKAVEKWSRTRNVKAEKIGRDKRIAFFPFKRLPVKYQEKVIATFGDVYEYVARQAAEQIREKAETEQQAKVAQRSVLSSCVISDPADLRAIHNYMDMCDVQLPEAVVSDMARAVAWLKFLVKAKPAVYGFQTKPELFDAAAAAMSNEGISSIKGTGNWIYKKTLNYPKTGIAGIFPRKYGNQNSRKLGDEQTALLRSLYSDPRKLNYTQIWECFQVSAKMMGWKKVSRRAIKYYLSQPEVRSECFAARHGRAAYRNIYDPAATTRKPLPDDVWEFDGTKCELWYRDGKTLRRLSWIVVIDRASWKILSYSLGETENGDLIRLAIRRAVANTGAMPHQMRSDNGSGVMAGETLSWLRDWTYFRPNQVGNARGKSVEPFFRHFFEGVLKWSSNYAGAGIKAKRLDNHANPEHIERVKLEFPDRKGLEEQLQKLIAYWNVWSPASTPRQAPNELYAKGSFRRRTVTADMTTFVSRVFWLWKTKGKKEPKKVTATYRNKGITFEWNKQKFTYLATDNSVGLTSAKAIEFEAKFFAENTGQKFAVKYDPEDLSMVALYTPDGRFVTMARRKEELPNAYVDYKPGEGALVRKHNAIRRRSEEINDQKAAATLAEAQDLLNLSYQHVGKDNLNKAEDEYKRMVALGSYQLIEEEDNSPAPRGGGLDLYGGKASGRIIE